MSPRSRMASIVKSLPVVGTAASYVLDPLSAMQAPQTFIRNIETGAEHLIGFLELLARVPKPVLRLSGRTVVRHVRNRIEQKLAEQGPEALRIRIEDEDPRQKTLFRLMQDAFYADPKVTLLFLSAMTRPQEFELWGNAAVQLQELLSMEGELRKDVLIRQIASSERYVYRYHAFLFALLELADGKGLPPRPESDQTSLGQLVNIVAKHPRIPLYPSIVDPETAHLRNAAAHGNHIYHAADDSLTWWSGKGDKKMEHTTPVAELADRFGAIASCSSYVMHHTAMQFVAQGSPIFAAFSSPDTVLRLLHIFEHGLSDEPEVRADAERQMEALMRSLSEKFS